MPDFLCWLHPSRPLAPEDAPVVPATGERVGDGAGGIAGAPVIAEGGLLAAITGRPRWLEPGLAATAEAAGHPAALIAAWRRFGPGCVDRMAGAFALAVLDPGNARLAAAIDRIGQEALHFARCRDGIVVATRAALLAAHPGVEQCIDPQAVYDYLYFHMIPAPGSIYADAQKLPAAHRLIQAGTETEVARYWLPAFSEAPIDSGAVAAELRATLGDAVERQLRPGTGSFLSGGLDSSTVTGLHARQRPGEAHAYGIGFDAPGYDELPYARAAAAHFGVPLTEYYVQPADIADTVAAVIGGYDEPFGNSSALPAYFCACHARREGATRLLAGDGGDELFAGNARYAKQLLFEQYFRLPGPLRARLIEPLLRGPAGSLPGLRKGRSYVQQALVPLPDRLESYNFLHRIDPAALCDPDLLASVDPRRPLRHLRTIHGAPRDASVLNRMLYLDWQVTLADNDLRKVNGACGLAGIEVAYPMLDDDVVALSCRVPSALKLRRGRLRHFYRQAMRGFLPEAVLGKRKHGFGLPFGIWLRDDPRLHELAGDMLAIVREQGWIRADFIDQLFNEHLRDHPAYYGEFVWVLMALGIWLEQHHR